MPTWNLIKDIDFSGKADTSYGAAGTSTGSGGDLIDRTGNTLRIVSGKLQVLRTTDQFSQFVDFVDQTIARRNIKIEVTYAAGDFQGTGAAGDRWFGVTKPGSGTQTEWFYDRITRNGDHRVYSVTKDPATPTGYGDQLVSEGLSTTTLTYDPAVIYRQEQTLTGDMPKVFTTTIIDQTNGDAVKTNFTFNMETEVLMGKVVPRFGFNGTAATFLNISRIRIFEDTDLQAVVLEPSQDPVSGWLWSAKALATSEYTYGGTGSFQVRLHRGTSPGFSTSGATAVTAYMAPSVFQGIRENGFSGLTPSTQYYYKLETYDGTTSVLGEEWTARSPASNPLNERRKGTFGMSYMVGTGASNTGTLGMAGIYKTLVDGTGKTCYLINEAVTGTFFGNWAVRTTDGLNRNKLWRAVNRFILNECDSVTWYLGVNDGGPTAAVVQAYGAGINAYIARRMPRLKYCTIMLGQGNASSQSDSAADTINVGLKALDDGRRFFAIGQGRANFIKAMRALYPTGGSTGSLFETANSGLHPNDQGHLIHGGDWYEADYGIEKFLYLNTTAAVLA